jgi:hypothetical protein
MYVKCPVISPGDTLDCYPFPVTMLDGDDKETLLSHVVMYLGGVGKVTLEIHPVVRFLDDDDDCAVGEAEENGQPNLFVVFTDPPRERLLYNALATRLISRETPVYGSVIVVARLKTEYVNVNQAWLFRVPPKTPPISLRNTFREPSLQLPRPQLQPPERNNTADTKNNNNTESLNNNPLSLSSMWSEDNSALPYMGNILFSTNSSSASSNHHEEEEEEDALSTPPSLSSSSSSSSVLVDDDPPPPPKKPVRPFDVWYCSENIDDIDLNDNDYDQYEPPRKREHDDDDDEDTPAIVIMNDTKKLKEDNHHHDEEYCEELFIQ